MPKVALDAIDRKILKYLIKNARMPFLEIARECGISGAAIHQRIRKLDEAGVILGSRLVVNPKMMGFDVCAHVSITLRDPKLLSEAIEELKKVPEIVECHFITGAGNILAKLYCVDNEHLMRTIFDGILHIQGLASTETMISLQEVFQREINIDFSRSDAPGTANPVRSVSGIPPRTLRGGIFFGGRNPPPPGHSPNIVGIRPNPPARFFSARSARSQSFHPCRYALFTDHCARSFDSFRPPRHPSGGISAPERADPRTGRVSSAFPFFPAVRGFRPGPEEIPATFRPVFPPVPRPTYHRTHGIRPNPVLRRRSRQKKNEKNAFSVPKSANPSAPKSAPSCGRSRRHTRIND